MTWFTKWSIAQGRIRFWLLLMPVALDAGCTSPCNSEVDTKVPIRRSEYVLADGARLYLLTRGTDQSAPVLLWIHGGPGGPERPLFRYFNSDLENHFVVAYWDQRGAGRSFDPKADPHALTISRHLADLDAVVDRLRSTSSRDKIILIGHSWGSALGLLYSQQHPEKVAAFVGVAQLVSLRKAQQAQYEFVEAEAERQKNERTLKRLRKLGPLPYEAYEKWVAMDELLDRYGGVFHKRPCKAWLGIRLLLSGLVTLREFGSIYRGIQVSLDAMTPELLTLQLDRSASSVDVPVFFFEGRYDRVLDSTIAAEYFGALHAPSKHLSGSKAPPITFRSRSPNYSMK